MISDAELIYRFLSSPGPVPDRADIIIALGTYDLRVADYAAEVFLSGRAPLLICSGGLGKLTSSLFTSPEAELFAARCRSLGVPSENADDTSVSLMVGDLQRLRVYAEKGFQAPVEVPDEIWSAYERLVAAGYDQYVIAS